ncbi:class D beta-lactamase [Fibrella sp. HMF5335]|uniref:Class D beta-lactamase n=1 Tax=Fibrella rubiginis TaxID=2817060 RepID=A0A939GFM0_9BACT|nr:class D beta-lactamase [Fibrella rubiginis]MBO0935895.1 class D beta-lactamase [Fibrella rubiginis]
MLRLSLFIFLSLILLAERAAYAQTTTERPDLQLVFDSLHVNGVFLLLDVSANQLTAYRPDECRRGTLPGSTFKMVNTLIGLETGNLAGPETVIAWDGVKRFVPDWNRAHTLESAFRGSVIPYYQELARRIGLNDMRSYLDKVKFGHMVVSRATLDQFWLTGSSTVSLVDQVYFLQNLLAGAVPFSADNRAILRFLMRTESTPAYKLFAKTGWVGFGRNEGLPAPLTPTDYGWYVGYLDRADGRQFIFATRLESPAPVPEHWPAARKGVTVGCLRKLGVIK